MPMTTIEEVINILESLPETLRQDILEYAGQIKYRFDQPFKEVKRNSRKAFKLVKSLDGIGYEVLDTYDYHDVRYKERFNR